MGQLTELFGLERQRMSRAEGTAGFRFTTIIRTLTPRQRTVHHKLVATQLE